MMTESSGSPFFGTQKMLHLYIYRMYEVYEATGESKWLLINMAAFI